MASEKQMVLRIAVLTVSDTRNEETDHSGQALLDGLKGAGHMLAERKIITDDRYKIRAALSQWIADTDVHVILITGGTGFARRDVTPEAVLPLLDKTIDGFGEMFRALSITDVKSSTIQSRALAGMANRTVIFCLPGSTSACELAWREIIAPQLDSNNKPCNFVAAMQGD
jgi:molybdenum cofactor biosynthesis protein B